MRQSRLAGPGRSELIERPRPEPGPGEALVRVRLCGVCASELRPWRGGEAGRALGHEVVGEVAALGDGAAGPRVGERVTGLIHEGFAEYALAPVDRLLGVPDGVPDEAALGEPLSCVISGALRTRLALGDRAAVVGLGYMGLLTLQALRLKGPARLLAVDVRDEALERALRFGADAALPAGEVGGELLLERFEDIGAHGLEVVAEASGHEDGLELAGRMVREHGVLSIVGYHQGAPRAVDVELWNWKAIEVVNAHERRAGPQMAAMARGLRLVTAGRLETAALVTHRFALDEVDAAFAALADKPAGFVKAVIALD